MFSRILLAFRRTPVRSAHVVARLAAKAFPSDLGSQTSRVARGLPKAEIDHFAGTFSYTIDGIELTAPYRIYNPVPDPEWVRQLDQTERLVLHCLYTRHYNGRVRQRHLRELLDSDETWVMPFIAELLGEYVVQIHEDIARAFSSGTINRETWDSFAAENREHLIRTRTRYLSYLTQYGWDWARERPGAQLAGRDAFAAIGIWPNRFARRICRKATRWHLPPYTPGSAMG